MSARVSVRVVGGPGVGSSTGSGPDDDSLTAVAVKLATTPDEIDRLAGEADLLRRVRHPGLISYVDHRTTAADGAELHTLYVGDSLERWQGTTTQAVGLVAALAATVADLHELGLMHGRLDRSHVLVEPEGRPVLCGLSPPDEGASPADDVAGIGRVLEDLLTTAAAADSRARRWRSVLQPGRQRALERIVAHAIDPVPSRRPTARALASSLLTAVPTASLPAPTPTPADVEPELAADPAPDPRNPHQVRARTAADQDLFELAFVDQHDTGEEEIFVNRPWEDTTGEHPQISLPDDRTGHQEPSPRPRDDNDRRRQLAASAPWLRAGRAAWWSTADARHKRRLPAATIGVAVLLGLVVGAISILLSRTTGEQAPPDGSASLDVSCPAPAAGGTDLPEGETYQADVDGDRCPEHAVVTPEGVIAVGSDRWRVGRPGDVIVLGDWNCDGRATPALYRASTGDVFVFPAWATNGEPLLVEPVAQVPGGAGLAGPAAEQSDRATYPPGHDEPACDELAVELPSGEVQPVEPAS